MRYGQLFLDTHCEDRLTFESPAELIVAKRAVEAARLVERRKMGESAVSTRSRLESEINWKAEIGRELGSMLQRSLRSYASEDAYFKDEEALFVLDAIEDFSAQPVVPLSGAAAYYNERAMEMVATRRDVVEQSDDISIFVPPQRSADIIELAAHRAS